MFLYKKLLWSLRRLTAKEKQNKNTFVCNERTSGNRTGTNDHRWNFLTRDSIRSSDQKILFIFLTTARCFLNMILKMPNAVNAWMLKSDNSQKKPISIYKTVFWNRIGYREIPACIGNSNLRHQRRGG